MNIKLETHSDERGFFREVLHRDEARFGQWSHSLMHSGVIKAWHLHERQTDWWYVPAGTIRAVTCDLRHLGKTTAEILAALPTADLSRLTFVEAVMGDNRPGLVLEIPPGVAHGCKVLQGPAHLLYMTSELYSPADEGRIPFDGLGYDWLAQDIR